MLVQLNPGDARYPRQASLSKWLGFRLFCATAAWPEVSSQSSGMTQGRDTYTGPRNLRNVQLSGNNGGREQGNRCFHSSQPPEIQRDPLKGWAKCPQHSSEKMLVVQIPNTGNCPGQNSECDTELGFWGHFPKGWHCLSSLLCLVSSSYRPWAVIKNLCLSRAWKMPAILTLGRQRQEDGEFEDSLKGPWL